jgi:4-hydroxy-3-methylbut-2-enyl diphosphate reductase IspH
MFIGIVGGLDRQAPRLIDIGEAAGHRVQCHTGTLTGASASDLRSLVDRSDLVVIVTGLNSHGAVQLARRLARRSKRPARLIQRLGATQFAALVQELPATRAA